MGAVHAAVLFAGISDLASGAFKVSMGRATVRGRKPMTARHAPASLERLRNDRALMEALADLASAAAAVVMNRFGKCAPEFKGDGSPVTIADREAEELILAGLARLLPGVPVISEEAASAGVLADAGDDFLLVDALDGTKEFVAGTDQFTVNIGMIHCGKPVGGVVHAPALGRLWLAGRRAETCTLAPGAPIRAASGRREIAVRTPPRDGLVAVASLRHMTPETEGYLARLTIAERRAAGSSLKFCLVAEGQADIYPRFSPTMEWDTAAGDAVLRAAGGLVVTADGQPLLYGKRGAEYHNPGFIAAGTRRSLVG